MMDPMMGSEPGPMDDMGGMNDMDMGMENQNFDENGEEPNDPKKDIQRLAGELSQALRMYNQEQQTPDTDLNKYVVGMIATQAVKDMTSQEKSEVIKKIKNGETIDDENDNAENEPPMEECKQNTVMDGNDKHDKRFNKKSVDLSKNPFSAKR